MESDYSFRPLEEKDRPMIDEIAKNTWNGHDHLSRMFSQWLSNPDCYPIGIIVNDQIVALGCVRIIESGLTAWLEGLRVHPDFRGRGFSSKITEKLRDIAKDLGAKRTRLTVSIENPIPSNLARSISMEPLFNFNVKWIENLDFLESHSYNNITSECEVEEFVRFARMHPDMVPNGVILYFWYALDATVESARILQAIEGIRCLKSELDNKIKGLSLGFPRMNNGIHEWCTTFYPTSESTLENMLHQQGSFCIDAGLTSMMIQYPSSFEPCLKEKNWLDKVEHGLTLALFEGRL